MGGGRLAVRQRQQRHVAVFVGAGGEQIHDRVDAGQPHVLDGVLDAARGRQVVDVLARAGEVHEGLEVGQLRGAPKHVGGGVELVVDVIFHGFHVVVRHRFMRRVACDAFGAELLGDGAQERLLLLGERLDARHDWLPVIAGVAVGEHDHPFDFDAHALAVERGLAQVFDERGGLAAVSAIERGEGDGGEISVRFIAPHPTKHRNAARAPSHSRKRRAPQSSPGVWCAMRPCQ